MLLNQFRQVFAKKHPVSAHKQRAANNVSSVSGALLLVALLFIQVVVPIAGATSSRSGDPDFDIIEFTVTSGGSVTNLAGTELAPNGHTLSVTVRNLGTNGAPEAYSVQIQHWDTWPAGAPTTVTTLNMGTLAAGATSPPTTFDWIATAGDDQRLTATIQSSADINSNNDVEELLFDVSMLEEGEVLADTLPEPLGGQPTARLSRGLNTVDVTVRNSGVLPVDASVELKFTPTAGGAATSFWSNVVNIQPGTLAQLAGGVSLPITIDGTSLSGSHTMEANAYFTASAGTQTVLIEPTSTVIFSDYLAELFAPADRAVEPGGSTELTFRVQNTGDSADSFVIGVTDIEGWVDVVTSPDGTTVGPIPSGAIHHFVIEVDVPITADRADVERVSVSLTSAAEAYIITAHTDIMAGDLYQGTLAKVTAEPVAVQPDVTQQIIFSLTNTGNVPTGYSLTADLSTPATGWQIEILSPTIDLLLVAEVAQVTIEVTPPELTLPLDPAAKLRDGDVVSLWLQAIPSLGGLPDIDTIQMVVDPVIAVDPVLNQTELWLTEQQVQDGLAAGGIEHFVDIDVEVRHNLQTNLAETVDVDLSIGTITFIPLSTGGISEASRWSASVSPTQMTLNLGEQVNSVMGVLGPSDLLPLGGTITVPIIASPTLGPAHIGSGVVAADVTHEFIIHVPAIRSAAITDTGPYTVGSGVTTSLTIPFENTGNDVSSYVLSIGDGLPDDWTVTITTATISNLSAQMEAWPLDDDRQQTDFTLDVLTSENTSSGTFQDIPIRVQDEVTGVLLFETNVIVQVEPRVAFHLTPLEQEVNLSVYEQPSTRVFIHNTGNLLTNFNVWIDDSAAGDVIFSMETSENLLIPAGFNDSVKIRLSPDSQASADDVHQITVWVEADGLAESVLINATIIPDHHVIIDLPEMSHAFPGEVIEITANVTNNGNLLEEVYPVSVVEGGWTVTSSPTSLSLNTGESEQIVFTITVPPLGTNDSLSNGDIHLFTVDLISIADESVSASDVSQITISALFELEAINWDSDAYFYRYGNWNYDALLINNGNSDIIVELTYSLVKPGTSDPSLDWQFDSNTPSILTLPVGKSVPLQFSVSATQVEPDLNLAAWLSIDVSPVDANVTGSAELQSVLQMSRFFQLEPAVIDATDSGGLVGQSAHWSHIPLTVTTDAVYEIEFCSAQRLLSLDGEEFEWNFSLIVAGIPHYLDLNYDCESSSERSRISLPSAEAWLINDLQFSISTPVWPNIYAGDGWDLTFRLYHPTEHSSYANYVEAPIQFILNNSADPYLFDMQFDTEGHLVEGEYQSIFVTLRNGGTALALGVDVDLECSEGIVPVARQTYPITILYPRDEITLSWNLTAPLLDWWDDSETVTCTAQLTTLNADGDDLGNNILEGESTIESWSPNVMYSFIGFAAMMILTLVCLRLGLGNEKFRLASAYTGLMCLGLGFHLGTWSWFGPLITLVAIFWLLIISWRSGDEFQLIHEDYQRARKGQNTMYRDHQVELNSVSKQLKFILTVPMLGFIAIILGIPPQMNPDIINILSLLIISVGTMVLVGRLLSWIDKSYATLYGFLTDTEIAVERIDRELVDPAKMLQAIARQSIDISLTQETVDDKGGESDA